jgi:hypothetical protein
LFLLCLLRSLPSELGALAFCERLLLCRRRRRRRFVVFGFVVVVFRWLLLW